jgi:hypothetical protein
MLPSDHWACFRPLGAVKGRWPYTRACFGRDLAKTNVTALAVAWLIEQYGDASAPPIWGVDRCSN